MLVRFLRLVYEQSWRLSKHATAKTQCAIPFLRLFCTRFNYRARLAVLPFLFHLIIIKNERVLTTQIKVQQVNEAKSLTFYHRTANWTAPFEVLQQKDLRQQQLTV